MRGARWVRAGGVALGLLALVPLACAGREAHRAASAAEPARSAALESSALEAVPSARWGRALALGSDGGVRAAVTPDGDVLVAATYAEPLDLGTGALPFRAGATGPHLLLARYGAGGELRWARGWAPQGEGAQPVQVGGLAVDASGDILLGGSAGTGLSLDGLAVAPGTFVARLGPDGRARWVRPLAREGRVHLAALALGAGGEVVAVGDFTGALQLADGTRAEAREAHGAFVLRLAGGGEVVWGRAFAPGAGLARARAVAVDPFGAVYVAGDYAGVVSFGDSTFVAVGDRTPFALKLDASGRHVWSRELAGAHGTAFALALGVDRVFVTGSYEGRFFFRGQWNASDWQDAFLVAYSDAGEERWSRSFGAAGTALATDGAGQVTLAGVGDAGERPQLFVARFLPDGGAQLGAQSFPGPGTGERGPSASALALAADGGAVLAGTVSRAGVGAARDGFLLRLQP
ncbi:hypothetical protein FGE12_14105 [Aggregicoccus sp. 17bor-14]|uniref:hypothetical protein n=1 Tax=Myxococcaceae TaxID=31 RepID=UPI00129CBE3B|nr:MULTISPECIES: hypothetical protein [Myxococcaceae]MBF5043528.1 hypothetical protein [Simulacricoccus sp. 17bor-14]MRI89285.1 hypothetical protein [Aggregicoccus sp. 17bor-14]